MLTQEVELVFPNRLFNPDRNHLGWKVTARRKMPISLDIRPWHEEVKTQHLYFCISVFLYFCITDTDTDTGVGVQPEKLDDIFSAFIQEDVSTTR